MWRSTTWLASSPSSTWLGANVDVDAVSANVAAAGVDVTPVVLFPSSCPLLLLLACPVVVAVALRSAWTWRGRR